MAVTEITSAIKSLTGISSVDTNFIESAQRFVVQSVPKNLLKFAQSKSSSNEDGSIMAFTSNDSILEVQRDGYSCNEIPFSLSKFVLDSSSLYFATNKHPVFWVQDGGIKIAPLTTSSGAGYFYYVDFSKVDDDSDLRNAVIYRACSDEFNKLAMASIPSWVSITAPTAPSSPDFGSDLSISSEAPSRALLSTVSVDTSSWVSPNYSKPTFSAPSLGDIGSITLPSLPSAPTTSASSVTLSGSSPNYVSPSLNITSAPNITDLSISSSSPLSPTMSSFEAGGITVGASSPSYTKASFTAPTLGSVGSLTLSSRPPIPSAPSFTYTDASVSDIISEIVNIADMASLTASEPSYCPPSVTLTTFPSLQWDMPSPPVRPVLSEKSVDDFSNKEPSYSQPSLILSSAPSISDLSINASSPVAPVLESASSVDTSSFSIPKYNAPVMVAPDWNDTEKWITTEEDVEMLNARISDINSKVSEYSSKIQDASAAFNRDNVEFQADVQVAIQNAQLSNTSDGEKIQKFAQEVSKYQADVNKEVQEFQQNLQKELQLWQNERQTDIGKFQADIQNSLNSFNKDNAIYQATLQEKIKEADLKNANDSNLLQKYSAEVGEYQAKVNEVVSSNTAECNCWQQQNALNVQKYNADIQNEIQNFNKSNVIYQEDIARKTQNFQKDIQEAIKNADNSILVNKSNMDKETQLALQNALNNYQKDVQEYASTLENFNSDLAGYQAEVDATIQKWLNEEWNQNFLKYQLDYNSKLQEYASDVQNNLNDFNKEQAIYQNELQEKIQEATNLQTKDSAEISFKIQKFSNDIQNFQADVNKEIQEYTINEIQKELSIWTRNVQTDLETYSFKIQDALNSFNKDNAIYQASLQKDLQNAQLTDADESRKLQKYQSQISAYQAEVESIIQKWINEEWTQNFQKYQTDYSSKLQEYQSDIQNELNEFNKEVAIYQAEIQKSIKDADLKDSRDAKDLQRYSSEIAEYQQNVNNEIQNYVNSLNKKSQEYQSKLALYTSDIQKFQAQVGEQAQENTMKAQNSAHYSKESDRYYQMATAEVQRYISNNEKMIQSTIAASQAAEQ